MPMIGIGEPVGARRSSASTQGPSVLVLDGGHPIGVLTRSDVLGVPRRRARPHEPSTHGDGFETRAIHAGQEPDAATGAVVPPISLATTFAQDAVGKHRGYEYSRSGNPTRTALETCVASLEGARHGLAFASGLAAEDAILRTLDPGDHVIIPTDAYGGTFRLVARVHERHGIAWTACDLRDPDALEAAWQRRDPAGVDRDADQPGAVDRRHRGGRASSRTQRDARVVVDNTFATPYLQQPLALGADASCTRATKYLGGHSDVVGGFVAVERRRVRRRAAVPAERDGRGAVAVRLLPRAARREDARGAHARHCANAQAIVQHAARARRGRPGALSRRHPDESRAGRCATSAAWCRSSPRRRGRRARARHPHPAVHARRVARRGRVADRAPGAHDPRVGGGLAARGRPAPRAPLGRHRVAEPTSSPTSRTRSTPSPTTDPVTAVAAPVGLPECAFAGLGVAGPRCQPRT